MKIIINNKIENLIPLKYYTCQQLQTLLKKASEMFPVIYLQGVEEGDYWLLQSSQSLSPHRTAPSVRAILMLVPTTWMR